MNQLAIVDYTGFDAEITRKTNLTQQLGAGALLFDRTLMSNVF
jgi:hypothetical protein